MADTTDVKGLYGKPAKKKARTGRGQAAREQADIEAIDEEWQTSKIDALHTAIQQSKSNDPQPRRESPPPDYGYLLDLQINDDPNEAQQPLNNQPNPLPNPPPAPPQNFIQYASTDEYHIRRIWEWEQWQAVFLPMFVTYMKCADKTSQWWDEVAWKIDRHQCSCKKMKGRSIDLVDIFSRKKETIKFCDCPEQVRLINMGYIGGSPTTPSVAFSIRLLRHFHLVWRFASIAIQPFCLSLDKGLDANCPLILVEGTTEPREWQKPFSSAIDAYRHMLRMRDELEIKALELSKMEQLASNCPRCFGPVAPREDIKPDTDERTEKPNIIACFDGNFQQRQHLAASKEYSEIEIRYPSLFLDPKFVNQWKPGSVQNRGVEEPLDPCSAQHKAADDTRNASSFKGANECGLVGMACRHDHCLAFVNIVQSGEKAHFVHALLDHLSSMTDEPGTDPNKVGILYDIGCHLEKGIVKNNLFQVEWAKGQLKVGTSAWHALVHIYSCQLLYNPRLLKGFGRSDGEGLERIWRRLSPLISSLRYASKQHRLNALNFLALHINELCRMNAARLASKKLTKHEAELHTAQSTLAQLSFGPNQEPNARPRQYFSDQWERKRTSLLAFSADNTTAHVEETLGRLIDLEEQLHSAHLRVHEIRGQRRNQRSASQVADLESLPSSIVTIETAINEVLRELGGDEFKNHPAIKDPQSRAIIRVRVAKGKLYEAKVGIIELQRDWDEPRQGTRSQQRYKDLMNGKQKAFKQKHSAYIRQVKKYNNISHRMDRLALPNLKTLKATPIEDDFWNIGHLSHPNEPWANDRNTRIGIEAFLTERSCQEELCRIAHEVRAMMRSAIQRYGRLQSLHNMTTKRWDPHCPNRAHPIKMVHHSNLVSEKLWDESLTVLEVLHKNLLQKECRAWMVWDTHIPTLLWKTQKYSDTTEQSDRALLATWKDLVGQTLKVW